MALTKVNRGGLNTGVSDSSNATFLTVDSSEQAVIKSEGGATTTSVQQGFAKAWVNFTGITTTAARDSLNLSSFTDRGTGQTTIVYATAMANNDYAGSYYTSASAGTGIADFNNAFTGAFGINEFRTTAQIDVVAYSSGVIDSVANDIIIHGDLV